MFRARLLAVATLYVTVAHAHWPHPHHDFKPMVDACKGLNAIANCSSKVQGICKTEENGVRSCGCHHHDEHGVLPDTVMHKIALYKEKMVNLIHGDKHRGGWPVQLGNCEDKKDGEVCNIDRPGQCVSSGKCPMFHNEMVCYPLGAHAPKFVTKPCRGKRVGDDCKMWLAKGKCAQPVPLAEMFCKMDWGPHEQPEAKPAQPEAKPEEFSMLTV